MNDLDNDGVASKADQLTLYSSKALAQSTPSQKPTTTITPQEDAFVAYKSFDYMDCSRYPEKHFGEKIVLKGTVLQVLGNRSEGFQIRLATSGSDDVVYVYINSDPGYNIIVDDRLTVYATMYNTITYESTWKVEVTIPAAIAEIIVLR
jgi:hypothetical protein